MNKKKSLPSAAFKAIIVSIIVLIYNSSAAAILTVSNNSNHPGQYATIQAALDAAVDGDTIYVHASNLDYASATIRKRVVIIGAGYNPINQFNQYSRVITLSLFNDAGINNASGTVITGFEVTHINVATSSQPVSNITISRNRIGNITTYQSSFLGDSWIIYNNIITSTIAGGSGSVTAPSSTNIHIQNNIIRGQVQGFSAASVTIDHNLFLSNSNLTSVYFAMVSNNIFVRSSGNILNSVSRCTFNNNLSNQSTIGPSSQYAATNSFTAIYTSDGSSSGGAGNIIGQNPQFVNVPNFDTYAAVGETSDYRLLAGSPGKNTAIDGTDLGIYGGAFPFPSGGNPGSGFDTSPTPAIPQVTQVDLQNASIPPNGTLQVRIQAKVNN